MSGEKPYPVVIWVHGGGNGGDKAEIPVFPGRGHGDRPFVEQAITGENASRLYVFLDKNIKTVIILRLKSL